MLLLTSANSRIQTVAKKTDHKMGGLRMYDFIVFGKGFTFSAARAV